MLSKCQIALMDGKMMKLPGMALGSSHQAQTHLEGTVSGAFVCLVQAGKEWLWDPTGPRD